MRKWEVNSVAGKLILQVTLFGCRIVTGILPVGESVTK
jgi:hypothetical protein